MSCPSTLLSVPVAMLRHSWKHLPHILYVNLGESSGHSYGFWISLLREFISSPRVKMSRQWYHGTLSALCSLREGIAWQQYPVFVHSHSWSCTLFWTVLMPEDALPFCWLNSYNLSLLRGCCDMRRSSSVFRSRKMLRNMVGRWRQWWRSMQSELSWYTSRMNLKVQLYRMSNLRVWVVITDHAEDDSGELFIAPTLTDTMENVWPSKICFWLMLMSCEVFQGCYHSSSADIPAGKECILLPLCLWRYGSQFGDFCTVEAHCQAVSSKYSTYVLHSITTSCDFCHLIAFTVPALIPSLTTTLLIDIGQKVILEDFSLTTFLGEILGTSPVAARHTAVAHINFQSDEAVLYYWAHPDMRPWGEHLPAQCPQCLSIRPWGSRKTVGPTYIFKCEGVNVEGQKCGNILHIAPPVSYKHVPGQQWISVKWVWSRFTS